MIMKDEDFGNAYRNAKYTVRYASKMNRKRQVVNKLLDELHNSQLDMIDRAVEYSDLSQAQAVIDRIRSL
jgi:hypothetical protein